MPDNYIPQFQHQDWKDNVDLVSAEDPVKGFNKRFKDLRQELDAIARIIGQINGSLAPLSTTLTFAPSLFPSSPASPWLQTSGVATKDPTKSDANGWLSLQLPNGLVIQSVVVVGTKSGNFNFRITLQQQPLSSTVSSVVLFSGQLADDPDGAFNKSLQLQPGVNATINNAANKYLITATIPSAAVPATASISAIQVFLARS
ncbi:hypothetical protein [Nostoc sp. ChiQUE01b]|uniref:hypothetical protein n=1 Tax=Nostoc sp. ChiQUE01b TaxID=3075376 RepID=UPI002AD56707|nr:hypothetical protein [Nostoc sp. ChiQUE01b]MDZ8258024.1 hypothetical protein [Nostoc sp. ChiQUE01b]